MQISRRGVVTTGAAVAMAPKIGAPLAAETPRPNIVWLVLHDVHAPLLGCYGNALAQTPAMDGLARDGVRYTNAFSTQPVCAPSRFALVTGAYPSACAPAQQMRARATVPAAINPLPLHMRAAGYYCTNNVFTDYNTDADEPAFWDACDLKAHWRNRPAGKPFFSVYNYLRTHESMVFAHTPTQTDPAKVTVPPFLPDKPEVREVLARNIDMVNHQDAALAHLLQELADDGLADDTFVFFTADHGGVHPRSKRYCYDDGLNVPLIVRVPAKWRHLAPHPLGQPNDELVSHVDMAPTVLALAGVPIPKTLMGRAFLGAHRTPNRDYVFSMRDRMDERYDLVHTVRDGQYRYIRNYNPQRIYGQHEAYEWQSVAYQAWERSHIAGELNEVQDRFWRPKPVEELYDTAADPHEITNLVGDPAHHAHLDRMRRALDAHLLSTHDNGFIPEGSSAEGYVQSRAPGAYPLKTLIETTNRVLARDPKNIPHFIDGLDHPNGVVRFWNAQGLVLAGPLSTAVGRTLARKVETERDDYVRCALAEALIGAGEDELAQRTLVDILQGKTQDTAQLRALNVLTVLPPERLRPVRSVIAALSTGRGEYLQSASKYLLLKIDGAYDASSPIFNAAEVYGKMRVRIGEPQV